MCNGCLKTIDDEIETVDSNYVEDGGDEEDQDGNLYSS